MINKFVLATFLTVSCFATEITILNGDPAGFGLNDPTPVSPVAGNMGTTLGEQRLNVIQRAVEIWTSNLDSPVPIVIEATMQSQTCTQTSATLAAAGANGIFRDFPNAPLSGTWYHAALANALAGTDLDPGSHDINVFININLDADPNCLGGNGWYYGFDHNEGAKVDLLAVLLHEFGHGLGFANFVNESTGTLNGGFPDVYSSFTRDLQTGKDWNAMTNAERQASAINDPFVVWTGPAVTAAIPDFLQKNSILTINAPGPIAGDYPAQPAAFGPAVPESGLSGEVVLLIDGTPPVNNGCEPASNGGALLGKIALIDRGDCNFSDKVLNAQNAGAIAVLIANNTTGLPPMGGSEPLVTIPSLGIEMSVGNTIKNNLPGVMVTLDYDSLNYAGTNGGFLRENAPNPLVPGSSISHWTPDATPSLLMEPAITPDLTDDVDITLKQFEDIGWPLLAQCTGIEITGHPENVIACSGQEVVFSVQVTGTDPTFQWKLDGNDLTGEVSATLILASVSPADAGNYTCEVRNGCTTPFESNPATLTIQNPTYSTSILPNWRSLLDNPSCEDVNANLILDIADMVFYLN
ncbi:MAG: immunoglobulin domain-containing protein [Acidobacteria bacterium]|nr:immunoglobulin domain-containing protein [Acidobacteriota bacterium]